MKAWKENLPKGGSKKFNTECHSNQNTVSETNKQTHTLSTIQEDPQLFLALV